MPGFFETMKRIAMGKPVFDTAETAASASNTDPQDTGNAPATAGPKAPPRVYIERTEFHMSGANMECYADIRNSSDQNVELDRIRMLSLLRQLDTWLRPGEMRQFKIYVGPMAQSEQDTQVLLDYKDASGDYFCGRHYLEYAARTPAGYPIRRIIYEGIKDI